VEAFPKEHTDMYRIFLLSLMPFYSFLGCFSVASIEAAGIADTITALGAIILLLVANALHGRLGNRAAVLVRVAWCRDSLFMNETSKNL
jgi:hypothetical protein